MALHYSSGVGYLFEKNMGKNIAEIKYRLVETDPTKYTSKKWWGELSTTSKIGQTGDYRIELEDGRKGDCIITVNTEQKDRRQLFYNFFGRGKLSGSKT